MRITGPRAKALRRWLEHRLHKVTPDVYEQAKYPVRKFRPRREQDKEAGR